MAFVLQPWQLFVTILAALINHYQQQVNDFQQSQIETLLESQGKKRQVIVDLVLRLAKENTSWGFDRIQGGLANVGFHISDTTVGNILKAHGIEPAPKRQRTGSWSTFLKAHWDVLAAIDFTTIEVWTKRGLVTFYLLFVMELKTRRVHFAGCTTNSHEAWMKQIARELTNCQDGFLNGKRYLLMDRDATFSAAFRDILEGEHVEPVRLPRRSPNLNAYIERYVSIFRKEIWHVRAVELWSRLGSGRCAGWDELKGGEFFSEDRFARVKPRLDFCQDIAEREMVQPF